MERFVCLEGGKIREFEEKRRIGSPGCSLEEETNEDLCSAG